MTVSSNAAALSDGYVLVRFIVKTGDKAMRLRLEFGVDGAGVAMFGTVQTGTSSDVSTEDTLKSSLEDYKFGGKGIGKRTAY